MNTNTNNTAAATATCPCCGRTVKLNEGRMSRHGFKRSNSGNTNRCDGSGRTVEDANLRRVQMMGADLENLQAKRSLMVDEGKTVRRITVKIDSLERQYLKALNTL